MALPAIAPTGQADLPVSTTSANVQIPAAGTPTQVLVSNLGPLTAYVVLGTSNTVAATVDTGTPILPYNSLPITLGTNTWLAGITQGNSTVLRLTAGT
ncbi:MAG: hypothetical protein AAFO57_00045 [Pseudomonadota bacterium]